MLLKGKGQQVSNLYLENEFLGTIGQDGEGLFIRPKRRLKISEYNLLISQLANLNPDVMNQEFEVLEYVE